MSAKQQGGLKLALMVSCSALWHCCSQTSGMIITF